MRPPALRWFRLYWPRDVGLNQLYELARLLAASRAAPVVLEAMGCAGAVVHRLGLPQRIAESVKTQLEGALPELVLVPLAARDVPQRGVALEVRVTTAQRQLQIEQAELVSRAVLTALSQARPGERVVLLWQLLAVLPPQRIGADHAEQSAVSVIDIIFGRRGRLDSEGRQALRAKRSLPVWRAVGLVAASSANPARRQILIREVLTALRLSSAPGVQVLGKRTSMKRIVSPGRSWLAPLRLNTAELATVAGWPIGVGLGSTRPLPPSKAVPDEGRVIGVSTTHGRERVVAQSVRSGLRHLHVLGPTGVGKSTLLLNLIVQDMTAGRGVVVIEPKGDLIDDVLARVPEERLADVVLLDPTDDHPVGLNPLGTNGRPPELVADELLSMFRSMYESSWGPRTNDILGASLLTLARTPGMTLCALPALLGDAGFRHRIVRAIDDPVGLEPFWQSFENWSEAERQTAVAPSLNRLRPFLLRPQLRAVLGQSRSRFDLSDVFTGRKILLVNLSKGALGSEAAALLGGLVLSQLWAAALRRSTVPADQREPVFVYVDEVQDYLHLPTDLADALVQARGLGVGFVLAHQHLSQLPVAVRSAILSNARSRICFQLAADDARALANGRVAPEDLRELSAFEVYAQLVAANTVQPWCSAKTLPAPDPITDANAVRRRSRTTYGVSRAIVDEEMTWLLGGSNATDDLTPRKRHDRGNG